MDSVFVVMIDVVVEGVVVLRVVETVDPSFTFDKDISSTYNPVWSVTVVLLEKSILSFNNYQF
jgi:hypothetical protein